MELIEILGFSAGLFVLLSFIIKDVTLMRIINILGTVQFAIYGVIIGAWAVWIINILILVIHSYYLAMFRPWKGKKAPKEPVICEKCKFEIQKDEIEQFNKEH